MAELGPVAGPVAAPERTPSPRLSPRASPKASPEVKSKLRAKKRMPAILKDAHPDTKFDRQPVFLIMASGQLESAEVILILWETIIMGRLNNDFICCVDSRV